MSRKVLVFGAGGMDGAYLCTELLHDNETIVYGTLRRSSVDNERRLAHIPPTPRFKRMRVEMTDASSIAEAIHSVQPDEIYNAADQDHVGWSLSCPGYSTQVTVGGAQTILQTVAASRTLRDKTRIYQPSSSTIFGENLLEHCLRKRDELSQLAPMSPYACAKAHVLHLCRYYRTVQRVRVSAVILFGHDGSTRGPDYLLQKIARTVLGKGTVTFTNPDHAVNIGSARIFMRQAVKMLREAPADDYVFGTDKEWRIRDLVNWAYHKHFGTSNDGRIRYVDRPSDAKSSYLPDFSKAKQLFGFDPLYDARDVLTEILAEYAHSGPLIGSLN